jgi:transketolase
MRGGNILRQEFGYETRVINTHTVKPIDVEAIVCAAKETEMVIAAEEHQIGALAWRVSGLLAECPELYGVAVITGAIWRERPFRRFRRALGVDQRVRGQPEHIAQKAAELIAIAKMKKEEVKLELVR